MVVPRLVTKATDSDDDSDDDVMHQTSIVAHVELLNAFAALAACSEATRICHIPPKLADQSSGQETCNPP